MTPMPLFLAAAAAAIGRGRARGPVPVEQVEVAFCLAGPTNSLPTLPVLKGLKRNGLQSSTYTSSLFAALGTDEPPAYEKLNVTLLRQISHEKVIARVMETLRPELRAYATYNTSEALAHAGARACGKEAAASQTMLEAPAVSASRTPAAWASTLYSMQLCYSLVRTDEITARHDARYDFVVRLRPDQLVRMPLPLALNVSAARWPHDGALAPPNAEHDLAVVAGGPTAAIYFRAFDAALSCQVVVVLLLLCCCCAVFLSL